VVQSVEDENEDDALLSSFNPEDVLKNGGGSDGGGDGSDGVKDDVDDRLIHQEVEEQNENEDDGENQHAYDIQENMVASSSNQHEYQFQNNLNNQSIQQDIESTKNFYNLNFIKKKFNFLDKFSLNYKYSKLLNSNLNSSSLSNLNNNDGVFNNLTAKPDLQSNENSDKPPTYEEAAADSTPPYWENSILSNGFSDEVFVDGLPVGNIINFLWNLIVSTSFQFIGFLLTYILHTSHAAKQGSRAGLGLTFISYGYYMIPFNKNVNNFINSSIEKIKPEDPNSYNINIDDKFNGNIDQFHSSLNSGMEKSIDSNTNTNNNHSSPFIAYIVIGFGIFIFIKALINYNRAKKMENVILQPPNNLPIVEEV